MNLNEALGNVMIVDKAVFYFQTSTTLSTNLWGAFVPLQLQLT